MNLRRLSASLPLITSLVLAAGPAPAPSRDASRTRTVSREDIVRQVVADFGIAPSLLEKQPWSRILQEDNWYHRSRVMPWPAYDQSATRIVAPAGGHGDFVCDGADDDIEIQRAIDSLPVAGGKVVVLPGTFVLGNCIRPRNHTELEIRGTLKVADAVRSDLTADVASGATTVAVADASRFRIGQWVTVIDDDPKKNHKGGRKYGESVTVQAIRGNTLTVTAPLGVRWANSKRLPVDGYRVARRAFVTTSYSAILVLANQRVYIHGGAQPGEIHGNRTGQPPTAPLAIDELVEDLRANCGISIVNSAWVKVENLRVQEANLHNIALFRSEDCEVTGVEAAGCNDKNICVLSVNRLRLINNSCHAAVVEDGICCHAPGGSYILIARNRTSGNPRFGIHVGLESPHPLVARNVTGSNRLNLEVRLADPAVKGGFVIRSHSAADELRASEHGVILIENSIGPAARK